MNFKNKSCIVTGGAKGIGKSIAESFFQLGANVAIWDIDLNAANTFKDEILGKNEMNNTVVVNEVDVSNLDDIKNAVNEVLSSFNNIDILVNNAGIYSISNIVEENEKNWDLLIKTNLTGAFLCIKEVLHIMIKNKYGKIINLSSISGQKESIYASPSYCASKAGVIGLSRCIAAQVAKYNINVNCVAPSITDTDCISILDDEKINKAVDAIPLKRIGKPEDITNAVLFLASDKSNYITGETINVNGGSYME